MPQRLLAVLAVVAALALAGCGGDSDDSASDSPGSSAGAPVSSSGGGSGTCAYPTDGTKPAKAVKPPPTTPAVSGQVKATMDTSVGTFTLTLDAAKTPCTVNSFVSLARQGFFDNTTCFRLTEAQLTGFAVLQCGDPTGTGTGGPGYAFADELTGSETYPPGTLAMANAGADTNGSQFFIVYGQSQLPPAYTDFGTVDAAALTALATVAAAGTDNSHGQGDGAPKTPVDISSVKIG